MSKLRSKAPTVEESKFQRLIQRGGATSKTSRSTAPQRAAVLLRLDPDLLARIDERAFTERSSRHELIVEILSSYLQYTKALS